MSSMTANKSGGKATRRSSVDLESGKVETSVPSEVVVEEADNETADTPPSVSTAGHSSKKVTTTEIINNPDGTTSKRVTTTLIF